MTALLASDSWFFTFEYCHDVHDTDSATANNIVHVMCWGDSPIFAIWSKTVPGRSEIENPSKAVRHLFSVLRSGGHLVQFVPCVNLLLLT